ncbi:hypothetical protein OQZ33_20865 [Pedobacter sp. MC2016-05]|uniref:hypothetical protein n=1 Tax=Pedobacter sp. MC2016-05 TaxID=2994474 RepID=UPI0022455037|nr:hypothetical protein [Pedobacter sp. MC2016-05]MCX2476797.1 hypothetical protein [Pedobacter sp. MC2016-05]
MKIKLSFIKAFLIALTTTIGFLIYVFINPELNSGYGGLFFLSISPAILVGVVVYCYIIKFFDHAGLLAQHFIFRFSVPFLVISLVIWIAVNTGDDPLIEAFQQYNFHDYVSYFFNFALSALLPLAIVFAAISAMLEIGNKEVVQK